ncbi:lysoplasmalogenase [Spirosoma sp. KNUC1025]|uniref:lysoplasmalogenase n=1 Tax=Spirosoma sp. KNUC1025 TaxID=2894082 RepID=UPI003870A22A|nr:lysoplasmalogenase [Spirosoma sp. KNUC1025]
MIPKPTLFFRLAFAGVTLLELIGETMDNPWLTYVCKPLIIGLLFVFIWQNYGSIALLKPARWLLIGMAFALAGDVFLMIRETDLFAPGLGAFLVMQLCYCVCFWQSIHQSGRAIGIQSIGKKAIPFMLYGIGFLVVLRPAFSQNPALTALWWPVVVYAICLCTMGLVATLRQGLARYGQVVVGALLFMFSDSVIAVDKFLQPITGASWLVMSTYAAAQYLIVVGMVQVLSTQKEPDLVIRPSRAS